MSVYRCRSAPPGRLDKSALIASVSGHNGNALTALGPQPTVVTVTPATATVTGTSASRPFVVQSSDIERAYHQQEHQREVQRQLFDDDDDEDEDDGGARENGQLQNAERDRVTKLNSTVAAASKHSTTSLPASAQHAAGSKSSSTPAIRRAATATASAGGLGLTGSHSGHYRPLPVPPGSSGGVHHVTAHGLPVSSGAMRSSDSLQSVASAPVNQAGATPNLARFQTVTSDQLNANRRSMSCELLIRRISSTIDSDY